MIKNAKNRPVVETMKDTQVVHLRLVSRKHVRISLYPHQTARGVQKIVNQGVNANLGFTETKIRDVWMNSHVSCVDIMKTGWWDLRIMILLLLLLLLLNKMKKRLVMES